ncbi:MAG TPA: class I SAM-dependent methyltransferase [Burkholderiales bacterium]|nr:class I SAM-dependent methyltransferase [Burkholderiales bacterium]
MKALSLCLALVVGLTQLSLVQAQTATTEFEPVVGQAGKDVVWVPTPDALITKMLKMAEVTAKDFVMDLGSGDGRIPIAAAKEFGANAVGVEFNPDMVALSNRNAQRAGVTDKVKFVQGDIFETDLSKADVITMYLLPKINLQLRPKLLALKPGTRIVTHAFDMGDWKADQHATAEERHAYLWVVPAQVAGQWKVNSGGREVEFNLEQKYQHLSGTARVGKDSYTVSEGRVKGENVHIVLSGDKLPKREFKGRFANGALTGKLQ